MVRYCHYSVEVEKSVMMMMFYSISSEGPRAQIRTACISTANHTCSLFQLFLVLIVD